jgi:SAM-dependent methyltransferase
MRLEKIIAQNQKKEALHLDLGCGRSPRNPFGADLVVGVDISDPALRGGKYFEFHPVHYNERLPFEDDTFDSISAFDFLEHLPRISASDGPTATYLGYLNEIHRVLKPEGLFLSFTPCYPHPGAFTDPTHVNYMTRDSVHYIAGQGYARSLQYGYLGDFEIIDSSMRFSNWLILESSLVFDASKRSSAVGRSVARVRMWAGSILFKHPAKSHLVWLLRKRP